MFGIIWIIIGLVFGTFVYSHRPPTEFMDASGWYFKEPFYYTFMAMNIICVIVGLGLLKSSRKKTHTASYSDDIKKCPKCAELIKLETNVCKHCNHQFSEEEIEKTMKERRYASGKFCHFCGKTDSYPDANGDLFCPNCKKIIS